MDHGCCWETDWSSKRMCREAFQLEVALRRWLFDSMERWSDWRGKVGAWTIRAEGPKDRLIMLMSKITVA